MKILILTTETTHHAFFVNALRDVYPDVTVFCEENNGVQAPYETLHPFQEERNFYERNRWFGGENKSLNDIAHVKYFASLNDQEAISALQKCDPDIVFVFGTGVLRQPLIGACPKHLFNLHGGDPEEYRGLDTHLWAIFHRDYSALVTTLHRLEATLDSGAIVLQGMVPLHRGMPLYALRAANTEICIRLTLSAIEMIVRDGDVLGRPQMRRGRYYSAMPSVLKSVCQERFRAHVKEL